MTFQLTTPVAFLIFNRPNTTQQVFNTIRQAKPQQLLVVADGPRTDRSGEAEKCTTVRQIIETVDWDCTVSTNYSDLNLGCKRRVSSGLNWVFETVTEAIILEDDCLPHPSFFRFCQDLLTHYREDTRIATISGDNFLFGRRRTTDSYYFSRYNHCWGWATWKRAWQYYDVDLKLWPEILNGGWLNDILSDRSAAIDWTERFQTVYSNKLNTWDYQWTFACWLQGSLSVLPNVNLVSNIGFGNNSTHNNQDKKLAEIPHESMQFPLQHPKYIIRDNQADVTTQKEIFRSGIDLIVKENIKKILINRTQK